MQLTAILDKKTYRGKNKQKKRANIKKNEQNKEEKSHHKSSLQETSKKVKKFQVHVQAVLHSL